MLLANSLAVSSGTQNEPWNTSSPTRAGGVDEISSVDSAIGIDVQIHLGPATDSCDKAPARLLSGRMIELGSRR